MSVAGTFVEAAGAANAMQIIIPAAVCAVGALIPGFVANSRRASATLAIRVLSILCFVFAVLPAVEIVNGWDLGLVDIGLFCISIVMWVVGLVWAVASTTTPAGAAQRPPGYPGAVPLNYPPPAPRAPQPMASVPPPVAVTLGPGRFQISGVDRETRMDTRWVCQAESPENAKVKAELEGIVVTKVERA